MMAENILSIDLQLLALKQQTPVTSKALLQQAQLIQTCAQAIEYQHGIAEAILLQAQFHWADMDFAAAKQAIRQALHYAKKNQADDLLAEGYHLSALIHVAESSYTHALSAWYKCLKLLRTLRIESLQIEVLIGLGNLWALDLQYEKSQAALNEALTRANQINDAQLAAKAAICLSREHLKQGLFEDALISLSQADRHVSKYTNPTWYAEIYNYRARVWLSLKLTDQAHAECLQAWQQIAEHDNLAWAQCLTQVSLAQVALAQNMDPSPSLNHASALAEHFNLYAFLSQIALIRSQYAEKQEHWDDALNHFKTHRQLELGALAQQQQYGLHNFNSLPLMQLAQKIEKEQQLLKNTIEVKKNDDFNKVVIRHFWLAQLQQLISDETAVGLIFVRFSLAQNSHNHQQRLFLLSALCSEHTVLCHYADGVYALLTPAISNADLLQTQHHLDRILQLLPWETTPARTAAMRAQAPHTLKDILTQIEAKLFSDAAL
ncbi:hypothetical protein [Deefgea salmonis]|uniref:MalT-like TPR region domain-containing protein n=1 Tax=Deefgea salmonis TaxID=2875502 RepID=A0ABS8BKV3_9NEIS|nr:hypothetical protein [Deefgea salmonis]MCB5196244.1 hypothetical protein [Deefgea salmonis]